MYLLKTAPPRLHTRLDLAAARPEIAPLFIPPRAPAGDLVKARGIA